MKKILSIDGGGIRGIIPALVLSQIEESTGQATAKHFDLIAGTSTGGILALGLSKDDGNGNAKYSARDLVKIYEERGDEIFSRSFWKGVSSVGGLVDELYSSDGIEGVLNEYFGDEPLGASLTKTLISSYDIQNRTPLFFKSWRDEFRTILMKDAARATSAAPTYFEPAEVVVDSETKYLVDGGVFINSPSVSAYAEAKLLFPDETDFFLLSLGTGELTRPISYREAKDWGKAGWLLPLLGCMFDGVADAADYQLKSLLGDNYVRMQVSLNQASDDMDNASKGNIENLKAEAEILLRTHKDSVGQSIQVLSSSN